MILSATASPGRRPGKESRIINGWIFWPDGLLFKRRDQTPNPPRAIPTCSELCTPPKISTIGPGLFPQISVTGSSAPPPYTGKKPLRLLPSCHDQFVIPCFYCPAAYESSSCSFSWYMACTHVNSPNPINSYETKCPACSSLSFHPTAISFLAWSPATSIIV